MRQLIPVFIILLLCVSVSAETRKEINLDSFIRMTLNNHPITKISAAEYYQTIHTAESAYASTDWNLFSNYFYTLGNNLLGTTLYKSGSTQQTVQAGASKLFSKTGTQFLLTTSYSAYQNQPTFIPSLPDDIFGFSVDLQIKQPLLRNAFGLLDRYPLSLATYLQQIAEIKYQQDIENFVAQISKTFLEWESSALIINLYKLQLKKALTQLSITEKQYQRGSAESLDVILMKQNVLAKKLALEQEELTYNQLTIQIQTYLSGTRPILPEYTHIYPSSSNEFVELTPLDNAIHVFKSTSLLTQTLKLTTEMAQIHLESAQNAQKAELNLVAEHKLSTTQESNSDVISKFGSDPIYTIGIEFKRPLKNIAATTSLNKEQSALLKVQFENKQTMLTMLDILTRLYSQKKHLESIITTTQELVHQSQLAYEAEEKRYQQGRTYSYSIVLDSQNKWVTSQIQLERLKLSKSILLIEIASILDLYLDKYALRIEEETS